LDVRQYRKDMEILEGMLEGVSKQIQQIADQMANRAWLAHPEEYIDTELHPIHERLTTHADEIIDKMQELQKAFNAPPKKDQTR